MFSFTCFNCANWLRAKGAAEKGGFKMATAALVSSPTWKVWISGRRGDVAAGGYGTVYAVQLMELPVSPSD